VTASSRAGAGPVTTHGHRNADGCWSHTHTQQQQLTHTYIHRLPTLSVSMSVCLSVCLRVRSWGRRLLDLIRRVACFGLTLVKLDLRQESDRHTEALDAITQYLGLGSYQAWSEEERQVREHKRAGVTHLLGRLIRNA
jgi:phosphoenolpyruvate carboxylase